MRTRHATHRQLVLAISLAAAAAVAPAPAHAAAELTVSPPILALEAEAGEVLTEPVSVRAGLDAPIVVELVHADFGFADSGYELTLIRDDAEETTAFSTRGWFSLPKRRYRIPAGRTLRLPLRIEVPENTPGGTYLGAALLRVVPEATSPGASQVQAVPETGPLLFISVEGGDPPKPALRRFELPRWVRTGPIRPEIVVENRGDEFFTYEGEVVLTGPGTRDRVKVRRQFVVPGQPRRLRTSADEKGEAGRPVLGTDDLSLGRYEVRTRLRIEPTGTTIVSTRSFWVVPMWARIAAVLAAIALAASIALLLRWIMERRALARYVDEAPEDPGIEPGSHDDDEPREEHGRGSGLS